MTRVTERSAGSGEGRRVVIVGGGLAGARSAVQLRERGWRGEILLVGAEAHRPYDRPPLSKAVLLGRPEAGEAAREVALDIDFDALDVRLELGVRATGLRPAERELDTEAGTLAYDHLVLATGAEPVALPGDGGGAGALLLRTLDDAEALRRVLADRADVLVVGAGWIGAEFATAARAAGCEVTVLEAADRPLAGVLPEALTAPMARWYAEYGVDLRLGQRVSEVAGGRVRLADGGALEADAVVVGIGARPVTGWLAGSGVELAADGSVRADAWLRTSVPGVYAVGDCASFPSGRFGRRLLVHHWDNALHGPDAVAANVLAATRMDAVAESVVYDPVPYFWSEQFGRFVQYVGHHADGDELLWRGDPEEAAWTVCWLRGERLVAVLTVGRPRDLAQGRRLVERGAALDRIRAADAGVPLKSAVRTD